MPVFISHRTADDAKAQALAFRLMTIHKIPCYLDHFDPTTKKSSEITSFLVDRINACTHLMALITNHTVGSWWVPFEIGVARRAPRRISSFDQSTTALPEYLTEWPVLTDDADLDLFAEAYHRDQASKPITEKYAHRSISSAEEFHRELKRRLGQ